MCTLLWDRRCIRTAYVCLVEDGREHACQKVNGCCLEYRAVICCRSCISTCHLPALPEPQALLPKSADEVRKAAAWLVEQPATATSHVRAAKPILGSLWRTSGRCKPERLCPACFRGVNTYIQCPHGCDRSCLPAASAPSPLTFDSERA